MNWSEKSKENYRRRSLVQVSCAQVTAPLTGRMCSAGLHFRTTPTASMNDAVLDFVSACDALRFLTVGDIGLMELLRQRFPRIKTQYEFLYVGL